MKLARGPGGRFLPRKKRGKARAKNPTLAVLGNPQSLSKAKAEYERFHGVECEKVTQVGEGKEPVIALGTLEQIRYRPSRGERKGPTWFHDFKTKGLILAASPDGKRLYIVDKRGGKARLVDWDKGIIA